MENLNIDQYLNKVDGNTLPATEWNACLTAVQTKVNELVGAVSNDIQMSDTYAEDTKQSMQLGVYGITFTDRENPLNYFAPTDYSQFNATGFDVHSGYGEPNPCITGIRFQTERGLELVKINTGDEYDGAYWGESNYGDNSTIRLDIDGSGVAAKEKIRWNTSGDVIVNSIVTNSILSQEDTISESYSITPQHIEVSHAGLGTTTVSARDINIAYNTPKSNLETNLSLGGLSIEHNGAYSGGESVSVKPGEISVSTSPSGEEGKEIVISADNGISINGNNGISTSFVVNGVEYTFTNGILTNAA